MSLFRQNGSSLVFVLLRVYQEELEPLMKMIIENGGAVSRNDNNMGIIFTQACNYSKLIWPDKNQNLIYDIRFIKKCVRKGKIVDPAPYKLSSASYFDCAIMHFLYGGCKCTCPGTTSSAVSSPTASKRQAALQTQSQPSTLSEDIFLTPIEDMSESVAIANPTGNTQDPLGSPLGLERLNSDESSGSTLTGSSTTVNQRGATDCPMQLSSGDDRPTEALNETEKRPCSIEYHTQVEPKLQAIAQRRKDVTLSLGLGSKKRQQRTPTTLTDAHDPPNVVSTPEDKSSNVDDVPRSAPSGQNGSASLSDATDDTGVSYVVKTKPNSTPTSPARSDASTIVMKSQSSAQSSRKRSHSEAAVNESLPESNWVVPDDPLMNSDINPPVSKYIRCENGERRLLKESQQSSPQRSQKPASCSTPKDVSNSAKTNSSLVINKFCKNYKRVLKFSTQTKPGSTQDVEKSKYFDNARVNCAESSNSSGDDDILIAKVPITREKTSILSSDSENEISGSKTIVDDESVNKPGPSGMSNHSRVRNDASTEGSSSDEQDDDSVAKKSNRNPELPRSQNTRNKKKSANGKSSPRLKVRTLSDLESLTSIDDVDSETVRPRKKTKEANKFIEKKKKSSEKYDHSTRNGKTRSPSIETVEIVDSDSSKDDNTNSSKDDNTNSRTTKIVRMKKAIKQSKHATKTWSRERDTCISSDDSNPPPSSRELRGADVYSESRVTRATTKNKDTRISSDNDSDTSSSSHALHEADLYTKLEVARAKSAASAASVASSASSASREQESGCRTWYTDSERRQMIQYIVDKEAFSLCRSMSFFESMASKKIFRHRSATSLYGEFRRILKNIDEYAPLFKLTASTVRQFKKIK